MTLEELGEITGTAPSQLSMVENGHREPRISLLEAIAAALKVTASDLLAAEPPSPRAALEIELERAQASPAYRELGLPILRPSRAMSDAMLKTIVGLHRELDRRARMSIATPEEARRANTQHRTHMRERNNHLPEIELVAEQATTAVRHTSGALTHRTVAEMAKRVGLTIVHTDDLPHSARAVVDLEHGRIYIPPASIPGGHGLRSLALQAVAKKVLEHEAPTDYADFLRQRLEASYFAAACLMPRTASVDFLERAKRERNIAIEDFRDTFGVTHEGAALRFTNLATHYLGITLHYLRVDGDGTVVGRVRERRTPPAPGRDRLDGGRGGVSALERAEGLHTRHPHQRALPVHGHARGHLLRVHADRHRRHLGVLHHAGRAVCGVEVVPGAGVAAAGGVHLPRRAVLPQARRRADGALEGTGLGVAEGAYPPVRPAAAGHLSGSGRPGAVRVPGGPRPRR